MDNMHYIVISDGQIKHTSGGIDSARLWAKRYSFAVILECNTVPLEEPKPGECDSCPFNVRGTCTKNAFGRDNKVRHTEGCHIKDYYNDLRESYEQQPK